MIKIRYSDLPAGLHVRTEVTGRDTFIYLLPGLTPAERRAALLRVRRSAGLGYGPRLTAAGLAVAILADRIRTTLHNGAAAFRAHPLLLLPAVIILVSATLVYIMTAALTITIRPPQASGRYPQIGGAPSRPAEHRGAGAAGGQPSRPVPSASGPPGRPSRSPRPTNSPRPTDSPQPTDSPSPSASAGPLPPGSRSPAPTSSPGPPFPVPSPSSPVTSPPSVPPSATPSPSPSPSKTCLILGPLGICLKF